MLSKALVLLAAWTLAAAAQTLGFRLDRVANHPAVAGNEVSIQVTSNGSPVPPQSVLTAPGSWTITVQGPGKVHFSVSPSTNPAYDSFTGVITLTVNHARFGATDPAKCSWQVALQSGDARYSASQDPAESDNFSLGAVSAKVMGAQVLLNLRVHGIPPPGGVLSNGAYWRVQATDSDGNRRAIQPVERALYAPMSGVVVLSLPTSALGSVNLKDASWSAVFLPPDNTLASAPGSAAGNALQQAKTRDDADLYVSGSYIAGVGTKPIWALDAKAGYSSAPDKFPVLNWFVKSSPPNLRFGIYGEITTNPDTQPPVDRSQVDPDSILAYTTLFQTVRLPLNPFFYGLKWEVQPVGGEFSRKYPASNLISGGRVRFIKVLAAEKRWGADLIPSLGFEGGKNLNQPGTLFMRPVDLHNYDAIARFRTGADANFYWYRRVPTPGDAYAFTLTGSWIARVPFTPEPFTTTAYLPSLTDPTMITRQQIVEMRTNTRHYVQIDAVWYATKLFGFQTEYKYGSLPPLFEFVSHQVSVGLQFKATYPHNHSVANPLP